MEVANTNIKEKQPTTRKRKVHFILSAWSFIIIIVILVKMTRVKS